MKRKEIRKERKKKRSNRVVRNEIIIAPDWVRPLLTSGKVTKTNNERYETFPFFQKHAQTGILKLYLWVVESQIGVNIARGWWLPVQLTGKWIPKFQRDLENNKLSLCFKFRKKLPWRLRSPQLRKFWPDNATHPWADRDSPSRPVQHSFSKTFARTKPSFE